MRSHSLAAAVATTAAATAVTLLLASSATAQVVVPNTLVAGAAAKAADVNANFQALATAINGLASRVAKAEGQLVAADLAGTYTLSRLQSEIGVGKVAHYVSGGTLTLAANGTGTLSGLTEVGTQVNFPVGTAGTQTAINRTDGVNTLSWSYTGGRVVFADFGSLSVADGGRLLISSSANTADGTSVMLLFVRTH